MCVLEGGGGLFMTASLSAVHADRACCEQEHPDEGILPHAQFPAYSTSLHL